MDKPRIPSIVGFLLGTVSSWLIVCYSGAVSEAGCPTLLPVQGWFPNSSQNYVPVTFTVQELSQVDAAMGDWTAHNTQIGNCSNVGLYKSTFGTYVITSTTGYLTAHTDWGAATSRDTVSSGHITSATTTFLLGCAY
jgi:hypothetical protein